MKIRKANKAKIICITSLSCVLVLGTFFLLFATRPTYSDTEKRDLAKFPKFTIKTLFNGDFGSGVVEWFSDTVPKRSEFLNKSSDIKKGFGVDKDGVTVIDGGDVIKPNGESAITEVSKPPVDVIIPDTTTPVTTGPATTQITSTQAVVTTVKVDDNFGVGDADGGVISNGIIVYKNRGMQRFGGTYAAGSNYAAYVNAFKADLGPNVNVYSMVIPTAQTFYMPKKYLDECASEPDNMTNIRNHLDGVIDVNIIPTLMEHKNEETYLRTDHHWAPLGAYYAAEEFAKVAKTNFVPLSTYTKLSWSGYVGTLYGYSNNNPDLKNNPETFYNYEIFDADKLDCKYYTSSYTNPVTTTLIWKTVSTPNAYLSSMGGDDKINDIRTTMDTGRTLIIFKDSYGNSLQPFLTKSFSRIITVDLRYFKLNAIQFIKDQGVTDVLFCPNTFSACGTIAPMIDKIRTQ